MKYRKSAILIVTVSIIISCSQQKKDKDIKADITTKAKTEIAFAAVNFTVEKGMVSLTGTCPSQKEKDKVESTVKEIAGVKEISNQIVIGPVLLNEDFALKQSVDSALKKYNLVTAQVINGAVLLTGEAKQEEADKIQKALEKLPVAGINNQLTIQ